MNGQTILTDLTESVNGVPTQRVNGDALEDSLPPVKRVKVDSLVIYDVKEDELKDLERGTPCSIYLNWALSLFSAFISFFIADIVSINFSQGCNATAVFFISFTICSGIISIILFCLWFRHRGDLKKVIEQIRERAS